MGWSADVWQVSPPNPSLDQVDGSSTGAVAGASQVRFEFPMTIRLRLTLWYTALLGATLILFSFLFYSTLAANLWSQTQQEAARQASEVANNIALQLQGNVLIIRNNPTRIQFPDLEFFTNSVGVQIIDLNGMILKRSSNLGSMTVDNYA